MKNHHDIDLRSLELAQAVADRIDGDPERRGLDKAKSVCERWIRNGAPPSVVEWREILARPWQEVRQVLLDPSEKGTRLRQSNPFCGVLTPRERWDIYRRYVAHETA